MGGCGSPLCALAGAWAERALCVCGGWGGGGADNGIRAEGAAAVARALESGRCGLTTLYLNGEWGAAGGPGRGGGVQGGAAARGCARWAGQM